MSVTFERLRARIGIAKQRLAESRNDSVDHHAVSAMQSKALPDAYRSVEELDSEKRSALLDLIISADWHQDHRTSIVDVAVGPKKLNQIPKQNRTKQQDYTHCHVHLPESTQRDL